MWFGSHSRLEKEEKEKKEKEEKRGHDDGLRGGSWVYIIWGGSVIDGGRVGDAACRGMGHKNAMHAARDNNTFIRFSALFSLVNGGAGAQIVVRS